MLRIGILGAARIAPIAVIGPAASNDEVGVTAVAASDAGRARAYASEHDIPHAVSSYRGLIESAEVDAVYVALPPVAHAEWSIEALRAGKHVLCEKPFAMNAVEAERMVAASDDSGCQLVEAFHYRFHPLFLRATEIVGSGALGEISRIDGSFEAHIPYRDGELRYAPELGGGAMMDLGCYPVNAMYALTGSEGRVASAGATVHETGVDTVCRANLEFEGGATATVFASMAADAGHPHTTRLDVLGTDGRMTLERFVAPHEGNRLRVEARELTLDESISGRSTYSHQLDHFAAVVAGREAALTGGADAIATMRMLDGIYRAAGFERPAG